MWRAPVRIRDSLTRLLQRRVLGWLVRLGKLPKEERDRMLRWKYPGFRIDTSVRIGEGRRNELEKLMPKHLFKLGRARWARTLWLVYGLDALICSR